MAENFAALEMHSLPEPVLFHSVIAQIHALCAEVAASEARNQPRNEIIDAILPARELQGRSPFVRRLQTWPRGYPGDYETIDYLIRQEVSENGCRVGAIVEKYALSSAIGQQHRNKIAHQAQLVRSLATESIVSGEQLRILSIACGGSQDIAAALPLIAHSHIEIVLNDVDPAALDCSLKGLEVIKNRVTRIEGSFFNRIGSIAALGPFDLVIAGGLFDYLSDKQVSFVLRNVFERLISKRGRLAFTNLATGNPFRYWMEYFANWALNERSEDDLRRLVSKATNKVSAIDVVSDGTGLALLVEAKQTQ